jgi:hypothetical protein
MPSPLVYATLSVIVRFVAKRAYGPCSANRYPAACASASVANPTRCCGETFTTIRG